MYIESRQNIMNSMELNLKKEINMVEESKLKFFFIGALIGVLPYLLLFVMLNNSLNERLLFKYTLLLFTIASLIINGLLISKTVYKRYKDFMEFKYDANYEELKKYFK